jgi:hypothetical protein
MPIALDRMIAAEEFAGYGDDPLFPPSIVLVNAPLGIRLRKSRKSITPFATGGKFPTNVR